MDQAQTHNNLTPRRQTLKIYQQQQKTTAVEYSIIQSLLAYLQTEPSTIYPQFYSLYDKLTPQMRKLTIFQYLNFQLWNDTDMPMDLRDKTQFFRMVSNWIIEFEMKVGDLGSLTAQVAFLREFFNKETNNMFERVILFQEIYDDLLELLGRKFWKDLINEIEDEEEEDQLQQSQQINEQAISPKSPKKSPRKTPKNMSKSPRLSPKQLSEEIEEISHQKINKSQAEQIIKFLNDITSYLIIHIEQMGHYTNCSLNLIVQQHSQKYKKFMQYGIRNVLQVNSKDKKGKNDEGFLQSHQQNQITRIALVFLQRGDVDDHVTIQLIKMLMLRTSKMVRYAMIVDYVKFYEYLERTGRDAVLQELEEMIYFRQLIIGRSQIQEAGLIVHTLGPASQTITVSANSRHRVMFSHEEVYGAHSLLQIQFQIQNGDINVYIYHISQGKQALYWKEQRTQDRRVDILLKNKGLYILQFNNTYSWVTSKKIVYKVQQFGKVPSP